MARIIKIDEDYYIEFYGNGLLFRKKAGGDFIQAQKMLEDIERTTPQNPLDVPALDVERQYFFTAYLENISKAFSRASFERYQSVIEHFEAFLRHQFPQTNKLSEVTPYVIECYKSNLQDNLKKDGADLNVKLGNFTLILLKDIFEFSISQGWLNDNPLMHVRLWKNPSGVRIPSYLSPEEIERLKEGMNQPEQLAVDMILWTGISVFELIHLRWSDFDFSQRFVHIKETDGISRMIPLESDLINFFQEWRVVDQEDRLCLIKEERAWRQEEVFVHFIREGSNCRLTKPLTPFILRNTFVKHCLHRGVSVSRLTRLLGWKDVIQLVRYMEFFPQARLP